MSQNFDDDILKELKSSLNQVVKQLTLTGEVNIQEIKTKSNFGDLCTPIFQLAKNNNKNPITLAQEIAFNFPENKLLASVVADGGFVNYKLDRAYCSKKILESILNNDFFYANDLLKGLNIMIEHTSANPNGPIHIGNFRGSIIGDTFARILKSQGANIKTHFYVDDLGHQIPVLVIGYELLKKYNKITSDSKIDHYLGQIYGITHTMYDIQKMKQELKQKYNVDIGANIYWLDKEENKILLSKEISDKATTKEITEYNKQFNFLYEIQIDIYKRFKKLYGILKECLEKEKVNLPVEVPNLNRRYMDQDKEAVRIVRATCSDVLKGQKEELLIMGITHDSYDWESELHWSGKVDAVLKKLDQNGFLIKDKKARIFDSNKAANLEGARKHLSLKDTYDVPNAIIITSTGDKLYILRDLAYSIEKIDHYKSDKVYNVIGKDQELTQRQLNLAIRAIDRKDVADKIWHLNYEFMELKGALTRMSARRLQYITPLELLEKTQEAVLNSFLKERDYPPKEKEEIARVVAVGAIKYAIIAIGVMKKLVFNPEEVISLNSNTSPFIQYAYARSQNILAKTNFVWKEELAESLTVLKEDEEWNLIMSLIKLPQIVKDAADQIKIELICNYLYETATLFNKFYDTHRVLDAETDELITARLALTYATGKVISSCLSLLGIESPKRM
ncbi:MAG: arginine--tRNA ligase [Candidatus Heimdallarchaeota archaeon]|nr:arginine--tRNA ligase [Candidatus Heimdallarchaeota archaeon]